MEIDADRRDAHDQDHSDESSADARDRDNDEEEESVSSSEEGSMSSEEVSTSSEEEESDPARTVERLISTLESNRWLGHIMFIENEMLPHLIHHIERFRRALLGNTVITSVWMVVGGFDSAVEVSSEDFVTLGQVFAASLSLEEVVLKSYPSPTGFNNLTAAAAFVRQTTQIQCLHLYVITWSREQTGSGFDTRGYAGILGHLPALESIKLTSLLPEEIGFLAMALPSLSNLKSVTIDMHDVDNPVLDDVILQQVFQIAMLQKFELHRCVFSKQNVRTISEFLSSDSNLATLRLWSCKLPKNGWEPLAACLKHNLTLETLALCGCEPEDIFFHTLKESLSDNRTLRSLKVSGGLSKQSVIDLVAAVRANYSLETVATGSDNCIDANHESLLECIPRLNQAGRRYMVEDPTSAQKGFHVLMGVKEDIDCSFLHLQENPSLCTELLRRVADGKRKADVVGQEDGEPSAAKKRRGIESGEADRSDALSIRK